MKFIIDRFEEEFAVLETDNGLVDMPKCLLPENAREGSLIEISVCEDETNTRREQLQNRLNKLFKTNKEERL